MSRSLPEIFCDRSLGRNVVPSRLREVHPTVHSHDDLFPQDTDDEVWLREAGRRGWIVLMKDDRVRRRPGEQTAVTEAGVRCFALHPSKGLTAAEMADVLVRSLPRILRIAEQEETGFVKTIDRRGRIRHVYPR